MSPIAAEPNAVTDYIDTALEEARRELREMRARLRKVAPDAEESVKWGMQASP